jgi:signal transduction histidine kinase
MLKATGTLTQRVVWALTGTVAIFVSVLVVLAYLTFDQMEDSLVNDILTHETDQLVQHILSGEQPMPARGPLELGSSMRAWLVPEGASRAMLPEPLRRLPPGLHMIDPGNETWHVVVSDAPGGELTVLYDATENEERVFEFGLIVLGLGAICIVAAYGLARRVAQLAVAPILDLTDRLATWAPGAADLDVVRDDEAGRLIEAFNRVQNQVDRSLAREREFAANLSHEVRTPLAAIRSDGELMLLADEVREDGRTRLNRIVRNVDAVVAALENARAMARDEQREPEPVDLSECLAAAWQGLEANAHGADLKLVALVPAGVVHTLDRYALLTVLRNLIRNAIDHAAPATLTVRAIEGGLEVSDDGKGIPKADLPYVFDRYYSGRLRDSQDDSHRAHPSDALEHGLGLAIAKRVCDMYGWTLEVDSTTEGPRHGTRFELLFVNRA